MPANKRTGGYSEELVRDLRDENASWRTRLRETEQERDKLLSKVEEANTKISVLEEQHSAFLRDVCEVLELDSSKAKESEIPSIIDKAVNSNKDMFTKAEQTLKKSAFTTSAVKQGVDKKILEDAYKLVNFDNVKVDFETMTAYQLDAEGKPLEKDGKRVDGLDDLVIDLIKEKPWLKGKPAIIGNPSNPKEVQIDKEEDSIGKRLGAKRKEVADQFQKQQDYYFKN